MPPPMGPPCRGNRRRHFCWIYRIPRDGRRVRRHPQVRAEQPIRQLARTTQLAGKRIGRQIAPGEEAQAARVRDSRRELRRRGAAGERREDNRRDHHAINRNGDVLLRLVVHSAGDILSRLR